VAQRSSACHPQTIRWLLLGLTRRGGVRFFLQLQHVGFWSPPLLCVGGGCCTHGAAPSKVQATEVHHPGPGVLPRNHCPFSTDGRARDDVLAEVECGAISHAPPFDATCARDLARLVLLRRTFIARLAVRAALLHTCSSLECCPVRHMSHSHLDSHQNRSCAMCIVHHPAIALERESPQVSQTLGHFISEFRSDMDPGPGEQEPLDTFHWPGYADGHSTSR